MPWPWTANASSTSPRTLVCRALVLTLDSGQSFTADRILE
jgi:hypothetical protein